MESYLTNTFYDKKIKEISIRDFNSENRNYYKGPYNCLDYADLILVDSYN